LFSLLDFETINKKTESVSLANLDKSGHFSPNRKTKDFFTKMKRTTLLFILFFFQVFSQPTGEQKRLDFENWCKSNFKFFSPKIRVGDLKENSFQHKPGIYALEALKVARNFTKLTPQGRRNNPGNSNFSNDYPGYR
jgi:hypothetical protein